MSQVEPGRRLKKIVYIVIAAATVVLVATTFFIAGKKSTDEVVVQEPFGAIDGSSESHSEEAQNTFTSSLPGSYNNTPSNLPVVPDDAPVAEVYSKLKAAALAGATGSACRIVVGLQKCYESKLNLATAANMAKQGSDPASREAASGLLRSYELSAPACEGVSDEMISESYRYQVIGASSGHRGLERWLAVKPALDPARFLQDVDQWRDYQRRAKKYFERALSEKSGGDLGVLLLVYAPADAPAPRPPLKTPDPATFLALYDIAVQKGVPIPGGVNTAAAELRETISPQLAADVQELRLKLAGAWDVPGQQESPYRSLLIPEVSICN